MYEPIPQAEKTQSWNPISFDIWVAWLAATAVAVAGATIFFYMNFQTKEAFGEYRNERSHQDEALVRRLERIEDKIDSLLRR